MCHSKKSLVSLPRREEERIEHDKKLKRDEHEMAEVFRRKVSLKMERLREAEAMLNREMIEEMKSLEQEKENLRELQERFQKEKKVLKHLGFS